MGGKNSGGAREGAGRKKAIKSYSDAFKSGMMKALKAKAKETGKTIQEIIVDVAYSDNKKWGNMRAAALKLVADVLVTKESHQTIDKRDIGPQIGLPPIKKPEEETGVPASQVRGYVN
jgi:hypothetical protein